MKYFLVYNPIVQYGVYTDSRFSVVIVNHGRDSLTIYTSSTRYLHRQRTLLVDPNGSCIMHHA